MGYTISQLVIYPVKSAAGIVLDKMNLDHRGPEFDRAWMVVDAGGRFVTQRKHPSMCLIETALHDDALHLAAPNMPTLIVPALSLTTDLALETRVVKQVVVWGDSVGALDCGDKAASWLSDYLQFECRLVTMPKQSKRLVDVDYAKQQQTVGFADGFPLLVASEASLASFNASLVEHGSKLKVDMQRFRPNIVVSGCQAYAEDGWHEIQVGNIVLSLVKPCSRCIMPAIEPDTGIKQMEIIDVLNKTRRRERETYFGQNALHDREGSIELGDAVKILM